MPGTGPVMSVKSARPNLSPFLCLVLYLGVFVRCVGLVGGLIKNPPRPLASRRVDALNQATNPPNLQNLQTNLLGGGFTLPLPPPRRYLLLRCWRPWRPHGPLDPSKSNGKTNEKPTFSLFGPIKAPHIAITCPIVGISTSKWLT